MKIDKTSTPLPASTLKDASARAANARTAASGPSAAESAGTSVHLGSTTAQLRSIQGSMAPNASPVDSRKVAEIKQAISEGRFQVNSGAVADSLIGSVRDLLSASQR